MIYTKEIIRKCYFSVLSQSVWRKAFPCHQRARHHVFKSNLQRTRDVHDKTMLGVWTTLVRLISTRALTCNINWQINLGDDRRLRLLLPCFDFSRETRNDERQKRVPSCCFVCSAVQQQTEHSVPCLKWCSCLYFSLLKGFKGCSSLKEEKTENASFFFLIGA